MLESDRIEPLSIAESRRWPVRRWMTWVHRYVGLVMAGFLLLAGITGSLIVWYDELDAAVSPYLLKVEPRGQRLDVIELRERVQKEFPQAWVHWLPLREPAPDQALIFWAEGAGDGKGDHIEIGFDEVFVDPYTGKVLGTRMWGELSQGMKNLMPFIYKLHYTLALGTVGTITFGIIALLWTIDCFVGAFLTFPPRARTAEAVARGWIPRWWPSWKVRWGRGVHRLVFDLHRAGGLWPWALLFVLAWSSVAFNLYDQAYRPVMGLFFQFGEDARASLPKLKQDIAEPPMGWAPALAATRAHMAQASATQGFRVIGEDRFSYDPHRAVVRLEVRSDRDVSNKRGRTAVFMDARTGALLAMRFPTGEASGDTVTAWLLTLHLGHIWGLPYRLFLTIAGIVVVVLSVTGVLIWLRKR